MLKTFTPIWHKYRAAIVNKMVESKDSAQQYQLYPHEFKALTTRNKGSFAFVLQVSKGKPMNDIRNIPIAQDLLEILQLSRKASELTDESPFEISLDKNFVLHISKLQPTDS